MNVDIKGPAMPSDITCGWLTQALRTNPELAAVEVADFKYDPIIGEGFTASMGRLHLTYAEPRTDYPGTLFLKQKIQDPDVLQMVTKLKIYLREVSFYQTFSSGNPLNPPQCFYAWIDDDDATFALLVEDLGSVSTLRQNDGHNLKQAKMAIAKIGGFHGHYQNSPLIAGTDWAPDYTALAGLIEGMLASVVKSEGSFGPAFVEKHGHLVTPFLADHAVEITGELPNILRSLADMPKTLLHGDLHCANMSVSATDVQVYDWQTVRRGPGVSDLMYYLSWMRRDVREANLDDLLQLYFQNFAASYSGSYSWDLFENHLKFGLLLHTGYYILMMGGPAGENEAAEKLVLFWADSFNELSEKLGLADAWDDYLRGERPMIMP